MTLSKYSLWIVALILVPVAALAAGKDDAPPSGGAALYQQYCSVCHDHPKDRIPAFEVISKRSPEEVVQALTTGVMRVQAGGLTLNESNAVATFVTGKAPGPGVASIPEQNLCAKRGGPIDLTGSQWNGWGRDLENSRYQPQPELTA
ncbi:MAG: c-type cytochrome, partial [Gammaproteobacteria bacterium]